MRKRHFLAMGIVVHFIFLTNIFAFAESELINYRVEMEDSTGGMEADTPNPLIKADNNGTGQAINAESDGVIAIRGESKNNSEAAGVAGYNFTTNGNGVFGQGGAKGIHGYSVWGTGVYGKSDHSWGGHFDGNLYASGNVGIGTITPQAKLHVNGDIRIPSNSNIVNADGRQVFHTGWNGTFGDYTAINSGYDWGTGEPVSVVAGSNGVFFTKGDASGTPYSETLVSINTSGRLITKTLQLLGGSDIAEPFDIKNTETIKPGMLMAIDPDHAGLLKVSDRAYDPRVAGVVSGANGINTGMIMSQEGSTLQGSTLIALSGRVYCLADATHGTIRPGDMLTTADIPGHAMKANDREKCFGAVIGKAMSSLDQGQGLVLVLVSLQ